MKISLQRLKKKKKKKKSNLKHKKCVHCDRKAKQEVSLVIGVIEVRKLKKKKKIPKSSSPNGFKYYCCDCNISTGMNYEP